MRSRKAFTLMELVVVVAIVVVLAAIALAFLPSRQAKVASQAADQVQTFLAQARSRALRDQVLTGVRFFSDDDGKTFTGLGLVQRPEPLVPYFAQVTQPQSTWTVFLQLPVPASPNGQYTMQIMQQTIPGIGQTAPAQPLALGPSDLLPGDYFIGCTPQETQLITAVEPSIGLVTLLTVPGIAPVGGGTFRLWTSYRFDRAPRALMGEPNFQMPRNAFIYPNQKAIGSVPCSQSVPMNGGDMEILFAPSGQVVNATAGRIVLWFGNLNLASKEAGTLLTIYARTGGVASHPIGPVGDEFLYTRDGRSSGQ